MLRHFSHLHIRGGISHGIDQWEIEPGRLEMLGLPLDGVDGG